MKTILKYASIHKDTVQWNLLLYVIPRKDMIFILVKEAIKYKGSRLIHTLLSTCHINSKVD